jgi:alpha-tubulin suppressor-like RCC1 family protein
VWSGYNQGFGEVNGTLYAWGSNTTGQLGTGGFFNVLTPLPVVLPAGQSVTNVSSPGVSTLFSLANGEVYGVGGNLFGQLGDNSLLTVAIPAMVHSGGVNLHDAVMGGYPNYAQLYPTSISAMLRSVSLTKLVVG